MGRDPAMPPPPPLHGFATVTSAKVGDTELLESGLYNDGMITRGGNRPRISVIEEMLPLENLKDDISRHWVGQVHALFF